MTPAQVQERLSWLGGEGRCPTRERLQGQQRRWLAQVLASAVEKVTFYRDLLAASGLRPAALVSAERFNEEEWRRLPVTTREQIQSQESSRLVAEGINSSALSETRTSGSSGFPLIIRHSPMENMIHSVVKQRTLNQVGLVERGVLATVIMDTYGPQPRRPGAPFERIIIDCRLDENEILRRLVKLQPTTLSGYPGALAHLAQAGDPKLVAQVRPRLTILGGEVVTDAIRESVREAFQAPVTTTYACNEFRWIAGECAQTGALHIVDDSVLVEILDEQGRPAPEGEPGEVVVTGLHSFAQPFIRYRLGDVATQGRGWVSRQGCECGAPYSTLRQVRGRQIDYIQLPSGQRVSSYVLTLQLVQAAPFIQRYQVIQEAPDRIRMLVIPKRPVSSDEVDVVRAAARRALGAEAHFDVELVERLIQQKSGKFKLVHSSAG